MPPNRFSRPSRRDRGTGLGLSSVFAFAKQSGGFTATTSAVDCGTTVRLYLPRDASVPVNGSDALACNGAIPLGDGELILVVEDDDDVREVTLKRLESIGYAVLEARTVAQAVQILKSGEPVVAVVTDVVMPGGMNGYDLGRWIGRYMPAVKIVLVSGYNDIAGAADGNGLPANVKTLSKPYALAGLARSIRELLPAART